MKIDINAEYIQICDEHGEIVYWDRAEWLDDPNIVIPIANAIMLALTKDGQTLRDKLKK
jgi:hypothetical protein